MPKTEFLLLLEVYRLGWLAGRSGRLGGFARLVGAKGQYSHTLDAQERSADKPPME